MSLKEIAVFKEERRERFRGIFSRKNNKKLPLSSDVSSHTAASDCSLTTISSEQQQQQQHATLPSSILKHPTQDLSLAATKKHNGEATTPKQVHFGSLTISSHEIILGDNPAVSMGLPLTIDWTAFEEVTVASVMDYEEQRTGPCRKYGELLIPAALRESYIKAHSTRSEMAETYRVIGRIRKSRQNTANRAEIHEGWKKLLGKNKTLGGNNLVSIAT
jgi:hypothetical protein